METEPTQIAQLEVTQIVTLFLRVGTEVIHHDDATQARALAEIQKRMTDKLDAFILALGDPVRFTGKADSPIYAMYRLRGRTVVSQVITRNLPVISREEVAGFQHECGEET